MTSPGSPAPETGAERASSNGASGSDPDAIRADIERTREDLAQTVDALHAKLDVTSRARDGIQRARDRATTETGTLRPEVVGGAVGVVLLLFGLVWWRRH